jgi:hypothetical protein
VLGGLRFRSFHELREIRNLLKPVRYARGLSCGHSGSMSVDKLPDSFPVPDVSLRLRCSACGSRNVKTQPDWKEGGWARNYGKGG